MKPTIYLAGPITGLNYTDCIKWREDFSYRVGGDIQCLSPLRGKDYLRVLGGPLKHSEYPQHALSTSRAITTRDFFDCTRADIIVANFLGATTPSIGTIMELAWAYQARVPVVAIIEPEGNVHDHGMIRETFGFRVATIHEAVAIARVILCP